MDVILTKTSDFGQKYQIINVPQGYANHYLIPKGLAEEANTRNRKKAKENKEQSARKAKKLAEEALQLTTRLQNLYLVIPAKTKENKKDLYGTITSSQVADALKEYQISITPKQISLPEVIQQVGVHQVLITISKDVEVRIKCEIKAIHSSFKEA